MVKSLEFTLYTTVYSWRIFFNAWEKSEQDFWKINMAAV